MDGAGRRGGTLTLVAAKREEGAGNSCSQPSAQHLSQCMELHKCPVPTSKGPRVSAYRFTQDRAVAGGGRVGGVGG